MSASDYPEHLNPFKDDEKKKSGLHIGSSFKEFKKTIRQSFRIKKKDRKDDVEIRKRTEPFYPRETQTWMPPIVLNSEPVTTPALPRSRFRERLAKSYTPEYNGNVNGNISGSQTDSSPNPFEGDGEKNGDVKIRAPRRKKRAPPPPKSSSSQTINEEKSLGDKNDSKWSLTSLETDISTENTSEVGCSHDLDISSEFQNFTKEMEKLNEDDNENAEKENNTSEETKGSNSRLNASCIPDVVITCVEDEEGSNKEEIDSTGEGDEIRQDKASEITENEDLPIVTESGTVKENTMTEDQESNLDESITQEKSDNISCSSNESLVVVDITSNLKNIENVDNIIVENESGEGVETEVEEKVEHENNNMQEENEENEVQINFNERKSIHINGSCNEINQAGGIYSQKISLYINGSRENLDEHNNNNEFLDDKNTCVNEKMPEHVDTPTPKQRKNKLTKDELLLGHNN